MSVLVMHAYLGMGCFYMYGYIVLNNNTNVSIAYYVSMLDYLAVLYVIVMI